MYDAVKTRALMLEQLAVVLVCWTKEEIEPYYGDVVEIVRRGLPDPAKEVRSATRDILCSFAALWYVSVKICVISFGSLMTPMLTLVFHSTVVQGGAC